MSNMDSFKVIIFDESCDRCQLCKDCHADEIRPRHVEENVKYWVRRGENELQS